MLSFFTKLCYSIMLHFLSIMLPKGTNYASCMTNYSHIKTVMFSLKSSVKQRRKISQVFSSSSELYCNIIEISTTIPKELLNCLSLNELVSK